jgi:hypothetical protein
MLSSAENMNKLILIINLWLLVLSGGLIKASDPVRVYGETQYTRDATETLKTVFHVKYRLSIYEPLHQRWEFFVGGSVSPDYDHFQNIIRVNTLTTFSLEF